MSRCRYMECPHSTFYEYRLHFTDADSVQFVEIGIVAGLLTVGNAGFTTLNQSYLSGLLPNDSAVVFLVHRTTQFVFTATAMLTTNTWKIKVTTDFEGDAGTTQIFFKKGALRLIPYHINHKRGSPLKVEDRPSLSHQI